jgi:hypothetical protein
MERTMMVLELTEGLGLIEGGIRVSFIGTSSEQQQLDTEL